VRQRLPGELAELAEPLAALERLRDHLGGIEQHLARQESDVRGVSGDVARGIDVQLRKATHQVQKLNRNLVGVTFGSISGLRVQARRIDRMDQVLGALREGAMQKLLFQPALPIEEALDEIFRRYGGGRSGGKRILDYREYVALAVEIRRRGADAWEPASSTRLSTGEAIGVGSALIMVILTEWEASANLLRRKRGAGSLRFLLLDEANRLSQDNLAVLFDLCRNLDVQLLIAAPEVARAEGNTTFRLVRRITEEGGEEVLVSGRRTVSPLAKDAGPTAGEG
jgi:chromosome partition protein MukB